MSNTQPDELSLYQNDHAAWLKRAAPRIATMLLNTKDDKQLLDNWMMLKSETKKAVLELLDNAMRSRIKLLCKNRYTEPSYTP